MDNQPITTRVQRTERRFTAHDGTFAAMAARASDGTRIWLDSGQQKQTARNIVAGPDADGAIVVYMTVRGAEDKQINYQARGDDPITWFEEET